MKKFSIAFALVALLALTSCTKKACYEFTITTSGLGEPSEQIVYVYCTEDEALAYKVQYTTPLSTCVMKEVAKSEADCVNN